MSSQATSEHSGHPPVRRVVTGHTPEGKSIVVEDAQIESHPFPGSSALFTNLYWTETSPPSNDVAFRDLAKEHAKELFPSEGSTFLVVEVPPGKGSKLHRTVSLDYGVLTHGQITLILEDDKRVILNPGDVVVQRGTLHAFVNEGTEWSRMYFVAMPAQKVRIGDKELDGESRG
ncbi:uncharacterized protein FOMMEDRAFT_171631 [Fomitiporia mediterranea MF3/22]|uniref:Cupin type-2 domain-containing protein n=1 Tax=Fomitiporia mediterranea (strain MF3/22) TaxID=694068 RepID=R7SFP2_FOMME|nr:uncharacterized protein FOMMEDRAFT_171631 [Fomitiporia mediterranea MF3/22]EJC97546.1 hypothetical protein FOMMEDRAFT_171631 [Fomitiporia mediterranea MF3/22]